MYEYTAVTGLSHAATENVAEPLLLPYSNERDSTGAVLSTYSVVLAELPAASVAVMTYLPVAFKRMPLV